MRRVLRQATTTDVWAIHEIARASWHAAYDHILGPERVDEIVDDWYAIGDIESSIDESAGRKDAAFLVAETADHDARAIDADDRCQGFGHVVPWPENERVGYLVRLYARPDCWGEGVGTALLDRFETAFDGVFDRLRVAVLADNDVGRSFYESRGFDRVGAYESDLGDELEEYVYERQL